MKATFSIMEADSARSIVKNQTAKEKPNFHFTS